MKAFRSMLLATLSVLAVSLNVQATSAQPTARTYNNPLVYVGPDGNYYVTSLDGTDTTTITSNPEVVVDDPKFGPHYGTAPRWSSLGTQFAFMNGHLLYIVESGKALGKPIDTHDQTYYFGLFAWSPKTSQIAYLRGDLDTPNGLYIIEPNGIPDRMMTFSSGSRCRDGGGGGSGSGPGPEHAYRVLGEDRDQNNINYHNNSLNWTSQGFLFAGGCSSNTLLISDQGDILWKIRELQGIIVTPDYSYAIGNEFDLRDDGTVIEADDSYLMHPVMINLTNAAEMPLPFGSGAEPLAWTNDGKSIIYGTKTLHKKIMAAYSGDDLADYQNHFDYIVTLWRQRLGEKYPTKLFQHEGFDFGRATVSPDDSTIVFSLISNTAFDKVDPEVQLVAVPMNGGQAQWIAIGGKPAFGKGPFTAIPASDTAISANPVGCPKGFVPRLNVGQRARVVSGYVTNLRTRPVDGALVKTMPSDSVLLVLDGPRCAVDGHVWWKVNYQGTVGWTMEGNSSQYWLER